MYSAILPHEWPARIARAKRLVIAQETVTLERCKPDIRDFSEEWKPALLDYHRQNENVCRLTSVFPDPMIPHVLVPHAEIRKLFSGPEGGPFGVGISFYAAYSIQVAIINSPLWVSIPRRSGPLCMSPTRVETCAVMMASCEVCPA